MSDTLCTICHTSYPLNGTVCHPCTTRTPYKQEQEQEKEKEQGLSGDELPSVMQCPPPACKEQDRDDDDGPDMYRLEEAYERGQLVPVPVALGAMPPGAGRVMRRIAEHMRLRMGLRLAVGDSRALPYAVSQAVTAGLAKDAATASRAIRALVRAGVFEYVGSLKPLRPGRDGTKLFAPPSAPIESGGERGFAEEIS